MLVSLIYLSSIATEDTMSIMQTVNVQSTVLRLFFFFFQAEDGIRDLTVTGVQTCALPIWPRGLERHQRGRRRDSQRDRLRRRGRGERDRRQIHDPRQRVHRQEPWPAVQIGRASCRERV